MTDRNVRWAASLLTTVLLLAAAPSVAAGESEIGFTAGLVLADPSLTGEPRILDEVETSLGVRTSYIFAQNLGWFVDGNFARLELEGVRDFDVLTGRTGLEILFRPHTTPSQWFVTMGGGWVSVDTGFSPTSIDRSFASFGFGQRVHAGARTRVRWELRADHSLSNDGLLGEEMLTYHGGFAFTWALGTRSSDSDGDGVPDKRDNCPDTPLGATIDTRGCPRDSDSDTVLDGLDRCPNTPRGWAIDARGCPSDTDGDGVPDATDDCLSTAPGLKVDARGCPADADGDGVNDGTDRCADTPRGARVDAGGCPTDGDADGVFDGLDRCPDSEAGIPVDATGCSRDSDGDGVPDGIDQCANSPRGSIVDANGCPPRSAPLFDESKRSLILEGVFFETNSAVLTGTSLGVLDRVAASLADWPAIRVEVGGHTDSSGPTEHNANLSLRRAESVRAHLVARGVEGNRITVRGYGEALPIADNSTIEGRARNRRVELSKLD